MMLALFGWIAIAVTWPLAVIAPWSIGLGPIGAQTVPVRLIAQALSGLDRPRPRAGLHRQAACRRPDPWMGAGPHRAIGTIARGPARNAPASAADLRQTGAARSRDAPRDRHKARPRARDIVRCRD